jgi:hypothetical protein
MNALSLPLLQEALSLAVPLRIREFSRWPLVAVQERCLLHCERLEAAALTLFAADQVTTAPEWTSFVEAIAYLSFRPEGVSLFGLHWRATHPEDASQALTWDVPVGAGRGEG